MLATAPGGQYFLCCHYQFDRFRAFESKQQKGYFLRVASLPAWTSLDTSRGLDDPGSPVRQVIRIVLDPDQPPHAQDPFQQIKNAVVPFVPR
jgi:hypothetical protein